MHTDGDAFECDGGREQQRRQTPRRRDVTDRERRAERECGVPRRERERRRLGDERRREVEDDGEGTLAANDELE